VSGPTVLVFRTSVEDPPPGIDRASAIANLAFAPDEATLADQIGEAEILFFYRASRGPVDVFAKASRLRWIQSASAGVDRLLFPELAASDVVVTNARGVFEDAIAEWSLGVMLSFATGIVTTVIDQRDRRWNDQRRTERLGGKRLLVVGPGPIGRAAARLARGIGMQIAAVGTRERDDDLFGRIRGPEGLHAALGEADYVLDTLPATETTKHLFDAEAFASMKPNARFLNVGRGATVDEAALVEALSGGRIAGAALDVFEEEPLPKGSPLWSMPNVIVSPHICGDFEGWERVVVDVFVDNLRRYVRGEPLRNLVDKVRGHGEG